MTFYEFIKKQWNKYYEKQENSFRAIIIIAMPRIILMIFSPPLTDNLVDHQAPKALPIARLNPKDQISIESDANHCQIDEGSVRFIIKP
ncbi:MAG: hypothetical protein ACMUIP_13500 [bacterium]